MTARWLLKVANAAQREAVKIEKRTALVNEVQAAESDEERTAIFKPCAVSQKATMTRNMMTLARCSD